MWCVTHQLFRARQQPVPSRHTSTPAGTALSTSTTPAGGFHHPERATHNAGQEMCQQFNLGRCNKGAECYFAHKCWVTGCGGDHSAKACPRGRTSGPVSSSELTPLYDALILSTNYVFTLTRPGLPGCLMALTMVYPSVTLALFLLLDHVTYLLHMHIQMWSMPNLKRRSLQAGSSVHLQNRHSPTCAPLALVWFPKRMESGEPYFTSQH